MDTIMEIIERAVMPNGTEIQLEDWNSRNTLKYPDVYGLAIGAYPIAKNTGKGRWVESSERFRLTVERLLGSLSLFCSSNRTLLSRTLRSYYWGNPFHTSWVWERKTDF